MKTMNPQSFIQQTSFRRTADRSGRRGITLLFVVSMIVLFLLMGTAFVLVANDYKRESARRSGIERILDDATPIIETALYEALVGPSLRNANSPLRGHSLFGDMYGYGYKTKVRGSLTVAPDSGGQLWNLNVHVQGTPDAALNLRDGGLINFADTGRPERNPGAFNGAVLTFTSGSARNISARIVDYGGAQNGYTFTIVPEWGNHGSNPLLVDGDDIVINGFPFSGYGAGGYDPMLDQAGDPCLGSMALYPNQMGETLANLFGMNGYLSDNAGINEPYDAVDFQNMFLAGPLADGGYVSSFHRKALVDYHDEVAIAAGTIPDLRPYTFAQDIDGDGMLEVNPNGTSDDMIDSDGDGVKDAVFIDIGLPIQSDKSGRLFKPLVAYRIEDFDGKININAHGSLTHVSVDGQIASELSPYDVADAFGQNGRPPLGQGLGPAEINPVADPSNPSDFRFDAATFDQLLRGNKKWEGRYGADGQPGIDGLDYWSRHKLFGHPRGPSNVENGDFGTVGYRFSTAMDIHSRFRVFVPNPRGPTSYPDPNIPTFPSGQPGINMLVSSRTDEFADHPYETDFSPRVRGGAGDRLFSAQELERVLRPNDRDSYLLPQRLTELLGSGGWANSITTDSWETKGSESLFLLTSIAGHMKNSSNAAYNGMTIDQLIPLASQLVGPEIYNGLPLNLNREWGNGFDDNVNGTVDEMAAPTPEVEGTTNDQGRFVSVQMNPEDSNPRLTFARNLYVLTLAATTIEVDFNRDQAVSQLERETYRKQIAQWAINVVDFRDADSINTPFEFDLDPFNGWDVDGNIATDTEPDREVVWGIERPELLITETIAGHDVRTEDDGSGNDESRLRPNAFAFVELYNPWTQSNMSQSLPAELYGTDLNVGPGVDVSRETRSGHSVWRLVSADTTVDEDIHRVFYLGASPAPDTIPIVYTAPVSHNQSPSIVPPGWTCVVGPRGFSDGNGGFLTPLGRLNTKLQADEANDLDLNRTKHIFIDPGSYTAGFSQSGIAARENSKSVGVIVESASGRGMAISDPALGYELNDAMGIPAVTIEDGFAYTDPHPPLDEGRTGEPEFAQAILDQLEEGDSSLPNFRIIKLQRLANPLVDFDPVSNPYRTVDAMSVNLLSYNGLKDDSLSPLVDASSFERGENEISNPLLEKRVLWKNPGNKSPGNSVVEIPQTHFFSRVLDVSLGRINNSYQNGFTGAPGEPAFATLTWNNRPFANRMELLNVPFVSQEMLTQEYSIARNQIAYRDLYQLDPQIDANNDLDDFGGRFAHLPNFYASENSNSMNPSRQANLFKLFDYVEVPSRFVGTEMFLSASQYTSNSYNYLSPFNFISRYRQPGKINLNTISNEIVWKSLLGQYGGGLISFFDLGDSRDSKAAAMLPTDIDRPFRPADAGNWVPALQSPLAPDALVQNEVDCGLFREKRGTGEPFFEYAPGLNIAYAPERDSYTRHHLLQKLGNTTTNRSSVFSIWITVAYFEVNPGELVHTVATTSTLVGFQKFQGEIGAADGTQKRHRGFFIVDRSIPVAFEPGKRHNVEKAILVQSIIEE